ncbi:MAG: putative RNA-binding protein with PUA-like domain [Planctomycetota bacterium]|jgi:predicted RNA-binding protein with PUA-like domain
MPPKKPKYWLMKSEPDVFSFDDLMKAPKRSTMWDGVRNYQARNFMRDGMSVGDGILFYHSNTNPPGVAGIAEVACEAYDDPTQFDPKDSHYDPKSKPENPRWQLVDIRAVEALPRFVSLNELKECADLTDMALVQRGNRLSVMPVSAAEWKSIRVLGGLGVGQRAKAAKRS